MSRLYFPGKLYELRADHIRPYRVPQILKIVIT